jgi:hypothetical protein
MKPPAKSPPKKRNLAARALGNPLFRPKVLANPKAYKRKKKVDLPSPEDDQIN